MIRRCLVEPFTYQVYTPIELSDHLAEAVSRMLFYLAKHGYQLSEDLEDVALDALRDYSRCHYNVADVLVMDIAEDSEVFSEEKLISVSVKL